MLKWLSWALLYVVAVTGVVFAESRHHIRVVLDLSKSMRVVDGGDVGNDPGGMAILSTILLYDLAHPELNGGDSFKVIPFNRGWDWEDLNRPPRQDPGVIIEATDSGGRSALVKAVKSLQYEANCTYFYPGLEAAVKDLELAGGAEDTRTIVLVTDGLPDDPCKKGKIKTKDTEKRLIEQELVDKRMKPGQIRLYVLPFGPQVNEEFFTRMAVDSGGRVFFSPGRGLRGENLLEDMLKLFADSLGYEVDGPDSPAPNVLKLRKEPGVSEAAVVVFNPKTSSGTASIPVIARLTPPPGLSQINLYTNGPLSEIAPVIHGIANTGTGEPGAAYSLDWVLNAEPGNYALEIKLDPGQRSQVAVLRKVTAELKFIDKSNPSKNLPNVVNVMANTELPLALELSNRAGGDPAKDIAVQFKLSTQSNPHDAPPLKANDYRFRKLVEQFPANNPDSSRVYSAKIEAAAYKNGMDLGNKIFQSVNVHPFLSIAPNPISGNAGAALSKGETTCSGAQFILEVQGHLPKPSGSSNQYTVTASLDFKDAVAIEQEFNGAWFKLDGKALQFDHEKSPASPSHPSHPPAEEWFKGREMTEAELLGKHEFCVEIGAPISANPSKNLDLPVHFVLKQAPYDDFDVIQPFVYRITLAEVKPPAPPEPPDIKVLCALGLALLFLLWHLRGQPKLPSDLGFALAPEGGASKLTSRPLGEGSILQRVLGLAVEKPIIAENGEEPFAWVRPVDGELYQLRLGKGVALTNPESGPPLALKGDLATVSVHRVYYLSRASKAYRLRLEYRT